MLGVQVVPARRRGGPRQVLDVRAERLREGRGVDAAVPRPRDVRPRDRADQLRRGGAPQRGRAENPADARRDDRGADPRHPAARAERSRARLQPRPVRRHPDPGQRRGPVVLDGEPARGRARVHDQGLRGGQVLEPAVERRAPGGPRARGDRSVRRVHAAGELRPAAAVHRRRRRHGPDPGAAALAGRAGRAAGRRSTTTGPGGRAICSTPRNWRCSRSGCPTSGSCRPCRNVARRRTGAASAD